MKRGPKFEFEEHTENAEEFKSIWLKADRDGVQKVLAKRFNISIATVSRVRKFLGLPCLHSDKHPGRVKLIKRVKKMYVIQERSTANIAKVLRMSPQTVNNILRKQGVLLRERKVTNGLYFKFKKSSVSTSQLIVMIKKMYVEGFSVNKIAKELCVDVGAVSRKLKKMGFDTERRSSRKRVMSDRSCLWCNKSLGLVWFDKGKRKQLYCCSSCKNKAKDLRRSIKGFKSVSLCNSLKSELKSHHKVFFNERFDEIVNVKPVRRLNV